MSKKNSRNNDFLSTYRNGSSPKIYKLLLELINNDREDLAEEITKVDYLIGYFNNCVKKRDLKEAKETLKIIKSRIDKLKEDKVNTCHLEDLYNNIIKINKIKL